MSRSIRGLVHAMLYAAAGACWATTPAAPAEPASSPPTISSLGGCWRGSGYQPTAQRDESWLIDRHADGTFEITFEAPPKRPHRESGRWTVHGDVYTTLTLTVEGDPIDPRDPQYVDVYQLKDVTRDSMAYLHLRTHVLFKSTRVPCPDAV